MKQHHIFKPELLPLSLRGAFIVTVSTLSLLFSDRLAAVTSDERTTGPAVADMRMVQLQQTRSVQQTMAELKSARVVLVGETHDRLDHHMVQLEVLKQMHRQSPRIAIGVEWFQQPFQQYLDDYIAGRIEEEEMLHLTGYFERWRYDYRLYQPILDYAREHDIPIIALNASRELTRGLSEDGFDDLDDDLRAQLPSGYDWSNEAYDQHLRAMFSSHPENTGSFDDFLRVQLTWDESMAERAAKFLEENPEHRMLILAGSGHVMYGWGIPDRLERRTGIEPVTVLVTGDQLPVSADIADYLVMSTVDKLEPAGLIGALIDTTTGQVVIESFAHNSAAEDAGIEAGDIILGVDDVPVSSFAGFKLAMMNKRAGDTVRLLYAADENATDDERQSVEVELR